MPSRRNHRIPNPKNSRLTTMILAVAAATVDLALPAGSDHRGNNARNETDSGANSSTLPVSAQGQHLLAREVAAITGVKNPEIATETVKHQQGGRRGNLSRLKS